MNLSIVIPSHNDTGELVKTIESASPLPPDVEIVVVDDGTPIKVPDIGVKVIRVPRRIGVGPARTLGAIQAKGTFLLFLDSHCRFTPGWFEEAQAKLGVRSEDTLYCGCCLGLNEHNMDVTKPNARYFGATFNFYGPDPQMKRLTQIMEANWLRTEQADDSEIPCVMGACYFIKRSYFLSLMPLRFLRSWGSDEFAMSLKVWLSGGSVKLMKNVRIGHKFRTRKAPFPVLTWQSLYNKLFIAHTCLPADCAKIIQNKFIKSAELTFALRQIQSDWHLVEYEKARNAVFFKDSEMDFPSLLAKFGLSFPTK